MKGVFYTFDFNNKLILTALTDDDGVGTYNSDARQRIAIERHTHIHTHKSTMKQYQYQYHCSKN